jgi:hypothetical protein
MSGKRKDILLHSHRGSTVFESGCKYSANLIGYSMLSFDHGEW